MKQARATSGSFYHFFPTKDDLLLAVLDAVGERIETEVLDEAEAVSDDPVRRVSALVDLYRAHAVQGSSALGLPIGTLVGELGQGHESALRRVDEIFELIVARITGWFEDGRGRWMRKFDHRELAGFIVASLEGASVMAQACQSNRPIDSCAVQLELHLDALVDRARSGAEGMPVPGESDGAVGDWKAW